MEQNIISKYTKKIELELGRIKEKEPKNAELKDFFSCFEP
jgi:hypothetical protein